MSAIIDLEARESDAESLAARVVDALIEDGILDPEQDPESILGGEGGYRPGPKISTLYQLDNDESSFCELATNGLELETKPWVNVYGMPCFEHFTCPKCDAKFEMDDPFSDEFLSTTVGEFYEGNSSVSAECPSCEQTSTVREWKATPHLGFCNLAFIFWNWPPFDSAGWKSNVPQRISEILGHKVATTYGRL